MLRAAHYDTSRNFHLVGVGKIEDGLAIKQEAHSMISCALSIYAKEPKSDNLSSEEIYAV
jgi:hypothetical protein